MSSVLLLLLLCLSVHACNARYLSIVAKEAAADKQGHPLIEDVDKAEVDKTQSHLGLGDSVLITDLQMQVQLKTGNGARKIHVNQDGENTMKQEDSKANFLKEEAASKGATSGDHIIVLSPNDLQRLAKTEGLRSREARWLLGSSPVDTEEGVDSKEDDFVDDNVVMDYSQPHRKPPIHNEKP